MRYRDMDRLFQQQLKDLSLPDVATNYHKRLLKQHILSLYNETQEKRSLFVKGGDIYMFMRNFGFLKSSLTLGVIAIVAGMLFVYQGGFIARPASAQEVMDRVVKTISDLTPEEREEIEKKIQDDLSKSVEEARQAKDLIVVPEEEIVRGEPPAQSKGFFVEKVDESDFKGGAAAQAKPVVPEGVTVLRYTDPEGRLVTLGIDKDNKPVFKMIKIEMQDIRNGEAVGFPAEGVKFEYKQIDN